MANTIDNLMIKVTSQTPEPPLGSVILRHGWKGTAYQRLAEDGRWHPVTVKQMGLNWTTIVSLAELGEDVFVIYHCEEGA